MIIHSSYMNFSIFMGNAVEKLNHNAPEGFGDALVDYLL
jgi:hypothetical protein